MSAIKYHQHLVRHLQLRSRITLPISQFYLRNVAIFKAFNVIPQAHNQLFILTENAVIYYKNEEKRLALKLSFSCKNMIQHCCTAPCRWHVLIIMNYSSSPFIQRVRWRWAHRSDLCTTSQLISDDSIIHPLLQKPVDFCMPQASQSLVSSAFFSSSGKKHDSAAQIFYNHK